jgi:hypothetical protein
VSAIEELIGRLLASRDPRYAPPPFQAEVAEAVLGASGAPRTPHRMLLERANGGYFFHGALHLLGACDAPPWHGLAAWNGRELWRDAYGELTEGMVFFAEDAFGDQYGYSGHGGEVVCFEAELGRVAPIAPHFVAFLEMILEGAESLLPVALVQDQARLGRGAPPGGQLYAFPPLATVEARDGVSIGPVDAVEAMRVRGQLARQIGHLAPGTQVRIDIDE